MNKINNKNLISTFFIFAIFIFGLVAFMPKKAEAVMVSSGAVAINVTQEAPINTAPIIVNKVIETKVKTEDTTTNKNLTASAASSGFMPSGILQWIIITLLILFTILLGRKAFNRNYKYHQAPLKRA